MTLQDEKDALGCIIRSPVPTIVPFIKRSVVGFLFNNNGTEVVLIKKNKPEWQADQLNGIGGKLEGDEESIHGIVREFQEETGVVIYSWEKFCTMNCNLKWSCDCFKAFNTSAFDQCKTIEEEVVGKYKIEDLKNENIISNIPWLIALALDKNYGHKTPYAVVEYSTI